MYYYLFDKYDIYLEECICLKKKQGIRKHNVKKTATAAPRHRRTLTCGHKS